MLEKHYPFAGIGGLVAPMWDPLYTKQKAILCWYSIILTWVTFTGDQLSLQQQNMVSLI